MARVQGWVHWFDKTTGPPRQLCCPTDGVGLATARSMSVPGLGASMSYDRVAARGDAYSAGHC
jgi:hypothetical protein